MKPVWVFSIIDAVSQSVYDCMERARWWRTTSDNGQFIGLILSNIWRSKPVPSFWQVETFSWNRLSQQKVIKHDFYLLPLAVLQNAE